MRHAAVDKDMQLFWRTSLRAIRVAVLISTRGRRVRVVITGVIASCVYETRGGGEKEEEGLDPAWEKESVLTVRNKAGSG